MWTYHPHFSGHVNLARKKNPWLRKLSRTKNGLVYTIFQVHWASNMSDSESNNFPIRPFQRSMRYLCHWRYHWEEPIDNYFRGVSTVSVIFTYGSTVLVVLDVPVFGSISGGNANIAHFFEWMLYRINHMTYVNCPVTRPGVMVQGVRVPLPSTVVPAVERPAT